MDNGKQVRKPIQSSTLKCGKRIFFFDVNLAKNNKKYLKITESAFVGENGERKRNTFLLFQEDVPNFQERLNEIAGHMV